MVVEALRSALAAECPKPLPHVNELSIVASDQLEIPSRPNPVASTVQQIGEHVPLSKVIITNPLWLLARRLQLFDCAGKIALIGKCAGHDDATFDHHLMGGRGCP